VRQLPGRIAEPPWIISLHYAPEPASHSTVMPYVDGGVAFGGFRFAQTAGLNQSWSDMVHIGWTVGAGVEYAFTDHLIGGVEYNYYGFSRRYFERWEKPNDHKSRPIDEHGGSESQL
jgi:opacity protein-like surface antigen